MSEDTTAHGAIIIDPPIDWTSVACPAAWLAIEHDGGPWRDALLRVIETREDIPGRAARRAGWHKHGRTRKCPACATPTPATAGQ